MRRRLLRENSLCHDGPLELEDLYHATEAGKHSEGYEQRLTPEEPLAHGNHVIRNTMEHVGVHVTIGGQPLLQPRYTQVQWCAAFHPGIGSPCTADLAKQAAMDAHHPWADEKQWARTMLGISRPRQVQTARRRDYDPGSIGDVFQSYAAWHNSTLQRWRDFDGNCAPRVTQRVRIYPVNRGLGDASAGIARQFRQALAAGEMLLLKFDAQDRGVWQRALKPPFDWRLTSRLEALCLTAATGRPPVHCPAACPEPRHSTPDRPRGRDADESAIMRWMFRPNHAVRAVVAATMRSLPESFVAVHFRSGFLGEHHSCGCVRPLTVARCAASMAVKFDLASDTPIFVASDSAAGVAAFQQAFRGRSRIVTLRAEMPMEHSLNTSALGACADFDPGTCGLLHPTPNRDCPQRSLTRDPYAQGGSALWQTW
jgi:hypothetical protein